MCVISKLTHDLNSEFATMDLGPLHYFLGVKAKWDAGRLRLSQQKYITDLLKKTNIS